MTDITAADCQAALAKHGNKTEAARSLGMSRSAFSRRMEGTPPPAQKAQVKVSSSPGRSLSDFRALYDKDTIFPKKINSALAHLKEIDEWRFEVEFAKLAGIGLAQLAIYREAYADHIVLLGKESKRAWAPTKAMAAAMRGML